MNPRAFLLIMALLISCSVNLICAQTSSPLIDSSHIILKKPSAEKEKSVFEDSDMRYKHEVKDNTGFFDQLLEWLSEKFFGKRDYETVSSMREIIIWTIIIISVIVIIWLLSRSELAGLIKPKAKATAFSFTDITDDLTSINFDEKISAAANSGDLRLAVRWQYLKTLYLLDKKEFIAFAPYKTNIDYNNELKSGTGDNKNLQQGFRSLSRIYEYVWYGQFNINQADYGVYDTEFKNYNSQLIV